MKTLKIIKIGGNIIDNEGMLSLFLKNFATIEGPKILVHGGGTLATTLAEKLGIDVSMIDGRRVTNVETLDVITMVYAGKINKNIVAKLQGNSCNAIGFTGADGNAIRSVKRPETPINYGFAGDVIGVETKTIELLLKENITPVFCAITHDGNGQLLNTNADTIASELAIAFSSIYTTELYYCFEKNGVLQDITNENSVIETITTSTYPILVENGVVAAGMLPKLNNCFHALAHDVSKVCIGKPEMLFTVESIYTTLQK